MTAPDITLTGSARFGSDTLFSDLSLTAKAAGWSCLLGPSGVGKTTILRLFAGTENHVDFSGDIRTSDDLSLTGRTALMAQTDLLLPWLNVTDNVTLGARLRGEQPDHVRAERLLHRVGLAGMGARHPQALSGGQRQRAALARTLMEDRPVVLLDEPFSALDARTRLDMQDLAAELLRGRTVLMVTHDPAEAARLADHIFILSSTGLVQTEPPQGCPPRSENSDTTLSTQAALLQRLRALP